MKKQSTWTLEDGTEFDLLTIDELKALPDDARLISISGFGRLKLERGKLPDLDTRCGYTAYGLDPKFINK